MLQRCMQQDLWVSAKDYWIVFKTKTPHLITQPWLLNVNIYRKLNIQKYQIVLFIIQMIFPLTIS